MYKLTYELKCDIMPYREVSHMASEAQSRASTKYNQKLNGITIRVDKEIGAKIREAAESRGMSLKEFLLMAVKPYIEEN